ncbi:MAG: hypothetical protein M2R45_04580 [Verrucomicrobia subdivision 3 bacterium]|nr:hypothetical protein [Limisphaerales bacterium]MCS1417355.1 hypothetical protein [Limisphaerales bacterium]
MSREVVIPLLGANALRVLETPLSASAGGVRARETLIT